MDRPRRMLSSGHGGFSLDDRLGSGGGWKVLLGVLLVCLATLASPAQGADEGPAQEHRHPHINLTHLAHLEATSLDASLLFDAAVSQFQGVFQATSSLLSSTRFQRSHEYKAAVRDALALRLLRKALHLDFAAVLERTQRRVENTTCLKPLHHNDWNARVFDSQLLDVPVTDGRVCIGQLCSAACSRVVLDGLVSSQEADALVALAALFMDESQQQHHHHRRHSARDAPESGSDPQSWFYLHQASIPKKLRTPPRHSDQSAAPAERRAPLDDAREKYQQAIDGSVEQLGNYLLYLRVVERIRRFVAWEYGIPAAHMHPYRIFMQRIVAVAADGAPGSSAPLSDAQKQEREYRYGHPDLKYTSIHSDQCSIKDAHYSGTLYLGESGRDFAGGELVFLEPCSRPSADCAAPDQLRKYKTTLTVVPKVGRAALFSSGWENLHKVEPVTRGRRYSLSFFFTTDAAALVDRRGYLEMQLLDKTHRVFGASFEEQAKERALQEESAKLTTHKFLQACYSRKGATDTMRVKRWTEQCATKLSHWLEL